MLLCCGDSRRNISIGIPLNLSIPGKRNEVPKWSGVTVSQLIYGDSIKMIAEYFMKKGYENEHFIHVVLYLPFLAHLSR